jgi:hypothetical protein
MKPKFNHILYFLLIFIIYINQTEKISGQETVEAKKVYFSKFFVGISAGPDFSQEINKPLNSVSGLTSKDKNTYSASIELGYFFTRHLGFTTGVEYSVYSSDLSLKDYSNSFTSQDADNETYEKRITGSDIKETQTINYLKIPVELCIRFSPGRRLGFFIFGGADVLFPAKGDYNGSGTFSYTGYYPAYNVTFQNLPAYGFTNDTPVSTKGSLTLKSPSFEGIAGAGLSCFITSKMQVLISASYARSLSTISGYKSSDTYQLTSDSSVINSLMGVNSDVTLQTIGAKLALRFYLK